MIIVRAVEIVNTWEQINFEEKDEVIIQALLVLVKEANLPEEELYYLESSIKTVIEMIFKSIKGDVVNKKNKREQKSFGKTWRPVVCYGCAVSWRQRRGSSCCRDPCGQVGG